jgi:thioredoxin-related protein
MDELKREFQTLKREIKVQGELRILIENLSMNAAEFEKQEAEYLESVSKSQKVSERTLMTRFTV